MAERIRNISRLASDFSDRVQTLVSTLTDHDDDFDHSTTNSVERMAHSFKDTTRFDVSILVNMADHNIVDHSTLRKGYEIFFVSRIKRHDSSFKFLGGIDRTIFRRKLDRSIGRREYKSVDNFGHR